MFKVIIALEEVDEAQKLVDACRMFIEKVKEMIKDGGCSACVLFEACMIELHKDDVVCMMNFDAIKDFSIKIGLLDEEGNLTNGPFPEIPLEIEESVVRAADADSLCAFLIENGELLRRIIA